MKTLLASLFAITMFFETICVVEASSPDVLSQVKNKISYPEFARKQGLEGMVLLSFSLLSDGSIQILEFNTNCNQLADYVIKRLGEVRITTDCYSKDITYYIRFVFKRN